MSNPYISKILRLIILKQKKTEEPQKDLLLNNENLEKKHYSIAINAFFIALILISIVPKEAKASFFDIVSNLFAKEDIQKKEVITTQNISLLNPVDALTDKKTKLVNDNINDDLKEGLLSVSSGPIRISTEDEVYIPDNNQISIYVVKNGDTLNSIAKLFGVSVNTIVWTNELTSRKAVEGDTLTILPISGVRYTASRSESIDSIASKYNSNAQDIATYNGIALGTKISAGETILIPDGEIEEEKSENNKTAENKQVKTKNTVTSKIKKVVKDLAKNGYYVRPISGGVRTTGLHGNNAVDLAAPTGTPIYAAAKGKVIIVKTGGYNGGYGNYIVISHPNGTQTLYAHNSVNYASVGDSVSQGQVIAAVGSTGKSTGSHVHFEVRGAVNPF